MSLPISSIIEGGMTEWIAPVFLAGVIVGLSLYIRFRTTPKLLTLTPGKCECTHNHCSHKEGKGKCNAVIGDAGCACMIYIRASNAEPDPLVKELERIARL